MRCPYCGEQNSNKAVRCSLCGRRLDKAREQLTRADGRLDRFCEEHGRKRRREREYGPVKATWPSP